VAATASGPGYRMRSPHAHDSALVEKFEQLLEAEGLPRIGGRMLGLLAVAPAPLSIDELARSLKVSRASISTNGKLLQSLGLVERITRPGDRRDYLTAEGGAASVLVALGMRRLRTMLELVRTVRVATGPRSPAAARIRRMERLYDNLMRRLQLELARQAVLRAARKRGRE
jgi:DNA-binding transcriptional regulator GbsR (MarR family)